MYAVSHFVVEPSHVIPGDRHVVDVTSLGNRLFVLRCPSEQHIEEYDSTTFTLQQKIKVHDLEDNDDWSNALTSSDNCLFVSGLWDIYRIDLTEDNRVSRWQIGGSPMGLSVNAENNLVVAYRLNYSSGWSDSFIVKYVNTRRAGN